MGGRGILWGAGGEVDGNYERWKNGKMEGKIQRKWKKGRRLKYDGKRGKIGERG